MRLKRRIFTCVVFIIIVNFILAAITNVSTDITSEDEFVFENELKLKRSKHKLSYEEEISIIRAVVRQVIELSPVGSPIPDYQSREPLDLLKNKSGLCYDRSRTYDKVFKWLGMETRHIYILYPKHPITGEKLSFWRAFFQWKSSSHAVTEVKTSRGWILVDSNSTWVSLTKDGLPVAADDIFYRNSEFSEIPEYFNRNYFAIRGLYSRRGQLYRPYLPYPQLNWADFLSWIFVYEN